jgi:hypothetical protein
MKCIIMYLKQTGQCIGRRKKHGNQKFNGKIPKTIYIASPYKNRYRISRPCKECIIILKYYGIKKVVYTTGKGCELKTEYVNDIDIKKSYSSRGTLEYI